MDEETNDLFTSLFCYLKYSKIDEAIALQVTMDTHDQSTLPVHVHHKLCLLQR